MTAPKHYPEADANGWIALSKRKPTKEDANKHGEVLWHSSELGIGAAQYDWNLQEDAGLTHWKPAGPGPVVETEEERQKREDEEAYKAAWDEYDNGYPPTESFRIGWHAALAHARRERK